MILQAHTQLEAGHDLFAVLWVVERFIVVAPTCTLPASAASNTLICALILCNTPSCMLEDLAAHDAYRSLRTGARLWCRIASVP